MTVQRGDSMVVRLKMDSRLTSFAVEKRLAGMTPAGTGEVQLSSQKTKRRRSHSDPPSFPRKRESIFVTVRRLGSISFLDEAFPRSQKRC